MKAEELSFGEMLIETSRNTKAKCFKMANKHENTKEAKQKVLKILNNNRNPKGYTREYKQNFVISIDGIKYTVNNNKTYLTKNKKNQQLKELYLHAIFGQGRGTISIAELTNKYSKKEVKFFEYHNTRLADIYREIVL